MTEYLISDDHVRRIMLMPSDLTFADMGRALGVRWEHCRNIRMRRSKRYIRIACELGLVSTPAHLAPQDDQRAYVVRGKR